MTDSAVHVRLTTSKLGPPRGRIVRTSKERADKLATAAHAVRASKAEVAAFEAEGRYPIVELA